MDVFLSISKMNSICRKSMVYPFKRFIVPDDKVSWSNPWPDYAPPCYSAPYLSNASWADHVMENENFKPKWNEEDHGIDRRSYHQNKQIKYDVVYGFPHNPSGRTGLCGRGKLGRWGPNHAADAIVTRWKRMADGSRALNPDSGSPVLQFIAILRKDCREWAIPGGFLNTSEQTSTAVLRELFEEAINFEKFSSHAQDTIKNFFSNGQQVYKGYVDDPRNTDNSWIETTAYNFHDETGEKSEILILEARDDAADVKWIDIVEDMEIYATHTDIIKHVKQLHFKSAQCQA